MKYLKVYKIFESLKDDINLLELEDRLIDFEHMGLNININIGNSAILDFSLLKPGESHILSHKSEDFAILQQNL